MSQRVICSKCDRELPPRQSSSGVDVLYVKEEECPKCRPRKIGKGITRVGGYNPDSKEKVHDPTLEEKKP